MALWPWIQGLRVRRELRSSCGVFWLLFLIGGCGQLPQADISNSQEFKAVIGKTVRLKVDVWQIEVSSQTPPKPIVDKIILVSGVGFDGNYVVRSSRLKKGALLRIEKVLHMDHWFTDWIEKITKERNLRYVVKAVGDTNLGTKPGEIYSLDIVGRGTDGNVGLRPEVYELVQDDLSLEASGK